MAVVTKMSLASAAEGMATPTPEPNPASSVTANATRDSRHSMPVRRDGRCRRTRARFDRVDEVPRSVETSCQSISSTQSKRVNEAELKDKSANALRQATGRAGCDGRFEVPRSFLSTLKVGFFPSAQTRLETALLWIAWSMASPQRSSG
jgi:hypothetical protein